MSLLRWWGFCVLLLCVSCGAAIRSVARGPAEHVDVPDSVAMYSTEAGPDGVVGGPGSAELARDIEAELKKRGVTAVPDGALGATASWVLREVNSERVPGLSTTDAMARRFGFAGVMAAMAGFGLDEANRDGWRAALLQVPPNVPLNRYGVSVSKSGRSAAVVFGTVEISLAPISRHLELNARLDLRGELGPRYRFARVYLTQADGSVETRQLSSRKVDTSFTFRAPGAYKLEVMGDGETGPVIVFNVPLYVAVEEAPVVVSSGHATSPAAAEARMFELLNEARKVAGAGAVEPDDELRKIALSHSLDMSEHHFFGHVSKSTGTPEDRARRSGVIVAAFGENIAQADSAETAHDGLMASPGHRANMLDAKYTHVGIAAVSTAEHQLIFTLNFGRRVSPTLLPRSAAQVEAQFLALRAKKGLSRPASDAIYRVAAEAGVHAYVDASNPSLELAVRAQNEALVREVQRRRSSRPAACSFVTEIIEIEQIEQAKILSDAALRRYGIAAQVRKDEHGSRLAVMMMLEGPACR